MEIFSKAVTVTAIVRSMVLYILSCRKGGFSFNFNLCNQTELNFTFSGSCLLLMITSTVDRLFCSEIKDREREQFIL